MTFIDSEILKSEEKYSSRSRSHAARKAKPYHAQITQEPTNGQEHIGALEEMVYFKKMNRARPVLTREQEQELANNLLGAKQKAFSYLASKPEVRSQIYTHIEKSLHIGKGKNPKARKPKAKKQSPSQVLERRFEYSHIDDIVSEYGVSPAAFGKKYERYKEHKANYALSRLVMNASYTPGFQQYIITEAEKAHPSLFKKDKQLAKSMAQLWQYKEDMFKHNIKLLISMAKKNLFRAKKMGFEDIYQEGSIGMMKAIDRFDPRKGFKFSTYALYWIKQSITRAVADKDSTIRVPVHMVEKINRYKKSRDEQAKTFGRAPNDKEVARALGIGRHELESIKETINPHPVSLSLPIGPIQDTTLEDLLPGETNEIPETAAKAKMIFSKAIGLLSQSLSAKELLVIKKRFGLEQENYGMEKTLQEVGEDLGVTRERIRQIEQKALRKARRALENKGLRPDFF
ncbi:sigma-70 family RNA polymerase sigma factor [Candidatus Woesearchaeota archaeon]|nr:sigma-70 family RNA polymerase sigma factor [Candidatus Woesearchaeota archaeon]